MTTTFHNHTDTMLADVIGDIDVQAKAMTLRLKAAKEEFKSRGLGRVHGARFTVTKSESVRWTLDNAAVKQAMGEAWCTQHSRTTPVTKLTVTVNRAALAQAA